MVLVTPVIDEVWLRRRRDLTARTCWFTLGGRCGREEETLFKRAGASLVHTMHTGNYSNYVFF